MADITITAADVLVADSVRVAAVEAGVAIVAGKVLVYDPTDDDYILASNTTLALSGNAGASSLVISVGDAGAGQRVAVVGGGNTITVGSVLSKGRVYVLSGNGLISPESDATSGDFVTIIGYALSATELYFNPQSTGLEIP